MHLDLAEPFEHLTEDAARAIVRDVWGVEPTALSRLDTERDDSFRVTTAQAEYVLKVAHPADDPLYVNLQTAALSFAAEQSGLPLQRILLTVEGEIEPEVGGRVARLLTWLPGEPGAPIDHFLLGQTLGRLSDALADFDHPAAHRDFAWDAARLDLLRPLLAEFPSDDIERVFDLYDGLDLDALPRQVIHNDFHPGNVLVADSAVSGILDFGDVVHTVRVVDLAVAQSYFGVSPALVEGFERVVPLADAERAALPTLVAARYAQRILVNSLLNRAVDARHDLEMQRRELHELLERDF